MLLLGSSLIGTPVMSLQTGAQLAQLTRPIIDPANLKILAYEIDGPSLDERPSYLRIADIREMSPLGAIVDSSDEFVAGDDVIKIKELLKLGFALIGMPVIDEHRRHLGKVDDFTLDSDSFVIQQLNVKAGLIRGIADTGSLIHRSQIREINDKNIVVEGGSKKIEAVTQPIRSQFINPFRAPIGDVPTPQADSSESN